MFVRPIAGSSFVSYVGVTISRVSVNKMETYVNAIAAGDSKYHFQKFVVVYLSKRFDILDLQNRQ